MAKRHRPRGQRRARKQARVVRRRGADLILLILILVVAAPFLTYQLRAIAGINDYIALITSVTKLILSVGGLIVVFFTGSQLWKFIHTTWQRQRRQRSVEDEFAMLAAQKKFAEMDWRQFEEYIGWYYSHMGYQTTVTPGQNDNGVDVILRKDGKTTVVQTKCYKPGNWVGRPEVQQFVGAMLGYDAGIFITTSDFSFGAKEYAATIPRLTLINGAELARMTGHSTRR